MPVSPQATMGNGFIQGVHDLLLHCPDSMDIGLLCYKQLFWEVVIVIIVLTVINVLGAVYVFSSRLSLIRKEGGDVGYGVVIVTVVKARGHQKALGERHSCRPEGWEVSSTCE